jgi:DNA-binding transcriptional regulator LsrR (DeoR family)
MISTPATSPAISVHVFTINGAVETNMSEKRSLSRWQDSQARYSMGIAMGEEKYAGILGALHGHYINCLVTNRENR